MKELPDFRQSPIIDKHYPLPKRYQFQKPWIVAQSRSNHKMQQMQNINTEALVIRLIVTAKQHLNPGERFFERNYRHDKTENCCAMHSFMTSSFYVYLECHIDYNYSFNFAFKNCPFEDEIRDLIGPFPTQWQCSEIPLSPDFSTYFNNILTIQDPKFILTL